HSIGVLPLSATGNAAGNGGDLYRAARYALQLFGKVIDSGISFNGGAQAHDHLAHLLLLHPFPQGMNVQLIRANAVNGGDDAAQHMVYAVVLLGVLNGHYIAYVLHYAYHGLVAGVGGANAAYLFVRYIMA